jgi:hypothetical protein
VATVFNYPSDDFNFYGVGSDSPLLQVALGDLLPTTSGPDYFPGLRVPRRTIWQYVLDGSTYLIAIMCSPSDPNYLVGPGYTTTVAGIDYTLVACEGELRQPQGPPT